MSGAPAMRLTIALEWLAGWTGRKWILQSVKILAHCSLLAGSLCIETSNLYFRTVCSNTPPIYVGGLFIWSIRRIIQHCNSIKDREWYMVIYKPFSLRSLDILSYQCTNIGMTGLLIVSTECLMSPKGMLQFVIFTAQICISQMNIVLYFSLSMIYI